MYPLNGCEIDRQNITARTKKTISRQIIINIKMKLYLWKFKYIHTNDRL